MNIVKMQDSLKDLSDRQLMQTMQGGSAPQYLVLAEMQRRKKVREDSAQPQQTSDRSVAEDIMGGIAAVPTRPMEMAEGGIVSFAEGGKTGRLKGEDEACWVDESTGEKYCPPDRPQMEKPRTGQRKTFQEGGEVSGLDPNDPRYEEKLRALAREEARRFGVDADLYERLIEQESGFNPNAVSPVGAFGLSQVMPDTARQPGYGTDPLTDKESEKEQLRFGAQYLRGLQDKYAEEPANRAQQMALAAYNAGPGAVDRYNGVPPFDETLNYVSAISGRPAMPFPAGPGQMQAETSAEDQVKNQISDAYQRIYEMEGRGEDTSELRNTVAQLEQQLAGNEEEPSSGGSVMRDWLQGLEQMASRSEARALEDRQQPAPVPEETPPTPNPHPESFSSGVAPSATSNPRGGAAGQGYTLGDIAEGITGLFTQDTTGGTRRERRERQEIPDLPANGEFGDSPPEAPAPTGRMARSAELNSERTERETAAGESEAAGETTSEDVNAFLTPPEQTTRPPEPELVREDGLMQLMRELQQERDRTRDESRRDAINQALIQTGLSMMASDNPDFLGALGEGGIQGLSAFASAQDAAAQRQGEISADMTDLMVAREANDIRRQAAQARAEGAMDDMTLSRINIVQDQIDSITKLLTEGYAVDNKEGLQTELNNLVNARNALMERAGIEIKSGSGGANGPANRTNTTIPGEE